MAFMMNKIKKEDSRLTGFLCGNFLQVASAAGDILTGNYNLGLVVSTVTLVQNLFSESVLSHSPL